MDCWIPSSLQHLLSLPSEMWFHGFYHQGRPGRFGHQPYTQRILPWGRFLKSRGVFLRGEMCVAIFGGKYQHLTTRIFAFKVCWRNECFMLVMKPDDSTLIANIGNWQASITQTIVESIYQSFGRQTLWFKSSCITMGIAVSSLRSTIEEDMIRFIESDFLESMALLLSFLQHTA